MHPSFSYVLSFLTSVYHRAVPAIAAVIVCVVLAVPSVLVAQGSGQVVSPDGWAWQNPLPQGNDLYGVWGSSSRAAGGNANDVYAVGAAGAILHYDGTAWSGQSSGTTITLYAVWGSSSTGTNGLANDVYAVGAGGAILHYNGTGWSAMAGGTTNTLYGVWGSSASDIYAVGASGTVLHYNGSGWTSLTGGGTVDLRGVWGSSSADVYMVGAQHTILHYDGVGTWKNLTNNSIVQQYFGPADLSGVGGSSSSNVYFVSGGSKWVLHYNGAGWDAPNGAGWDAINISVLEAGTMNAVWSGSSGDAFLVGGLNRYTGTLLDMKSSGPLVIDTSSYGFLYGIWGGSTTDVFVVGAGGAISHYDGASVTQMNSASCFWFECFQAVSGSSFGDVFATGVGQGTYALGGTMHYDGSNWTLVPGWGVNRFDSIWVNSPTDAYGAAQGGWLVRYDGSQWTWQPNAFSGTIYSLRGIPGPGVTNLFAAGAGGVAQYDFSQSNWSYLFTGGAFYGVWAGQAACPDGSASTEVVAVGAGGARMETTCGFGSYQAPPPSGSDLYSVWGSSLRDTSGKANDVFAVGAGGAILHFDGANWTSMTSGTTNILYGVWGSSSTDANGHANDVYAVGASGAILHYNGASWTSMRSGTQNDLRGVWGTTSDVFAVGAYGTILHYLPPAVPNNPIPAISSISPPAMPYGSASYTVTVNGTNFVSGSSVRFNGLSVTTTFISSNQLAATVPAADVPSAGSFPVTVFNPAPGGGTSNAQNFKVTTVQTSLSVASASGTYGSTMTLTATLTPAVAGKAISFTLGASASGGSAIGAVGSANTMIDASGNAVATWSGALPAAANAGTYPLTASFAGDTNYAPSSASASLTLSQAATSLVILGQPVTGFYSGTVTLKASLTLKGSPVVGRSISFSLLGQPVLGCPTTGACIAFTTITLPSATTDSSGIATLTGVSLVTLEYAYGPNPQWIGFGLHAGAIGASFAGDGSGGTYTGSSATADLNVTPAPTITTTTDVTAGYSLRGILVNLSATVTTTASTSPVSEGFVTFSLAGQSAAVPVYMGGTAEAGFIVFASPNQKLPISAQFNAPGAQYDPNFGPSADNSHYVTIAATPTAHVEMVSLTIPKEVQTVTPDNFTLAATVMNHGPDTAPTVYVHFGFYNSNGIFVPLADNSTSVIYNLPPNVPYQTTYTYPYAWHDPGSTATLTLPAQLVASAEAPASFDPNPNNNTSTIVLNGFHYLPFTLKVNGYDFDNNKSTTDLWQLYQSIFVNDALWTPWAIAYYNNAFKPGFSGDCYGMSASSLQFFRGRDDFHTYAPGAANVYAMQTNNYAPDNPTWLNIETYQGLQFGDTVQSWYGSVSRGPVATLGSVEAALDSGAAPPILSLWGAHDSHAVVPYRIVEATIGGNASADIYIYDSNYQGDPTQVVQVNRAAGTFSTAYSQYGGRSGLSYVPSNLNDNRSPSLPLLGIGATSGMLAVASGPANLLNTNSQGQSLGYQNGTLVSQIPGAFQILPMVDTPGSSTFPEAYRLPAGQYVTTFSGNGAAPPGPATANLFRATSLLTYTSNNMAATTHDSITLSPDGSTVTLGTDAANEQFSATLSNNLGSSAREYTIANTSVASGEKITLAVINGATGGTSFQIVNQGGSKSYDLTLDQVGAGAGTTTIKGLSIGANETHVFTPGDWTKLNSTSLNLQITNSHGTTAGTLAAPSITSASSASFTYGTGGTFTVTTTGFPRPLLNETGTLPPGVVWNPSTGALTVAPSVAAGIYPISLVAVNPLGTSPAQAFTLTISPARLTIAADNKTKVYGAPLPALTATYSGLVNGDTSSALAGALNCTTTATAMSGVGGYPITCSGQTSTNYTITYVAAQLSVTQDPTSVSVKSSATLVVMGQSVTFTAVVVATPPGSGTPTGTVTFKDGTTTLGTGTLASGQATFATSILSVGSHSITAQYGGDTNFVAGAGTFTQQVQYNISALYDQTKAVQSGSTVPIKLYLCDSNGNDVSSPSIVLHGTQVVNVSGVSGTPEPPGNANPDNDFVFDSTLGTSGGYHFNLKTTGLTPGTYSLLFTVTNDPVTHSVAFGVK